MVCGSCVPCHCAEVDFPAIMLGRCVPCHCAEVGGAGRGPRFCGYRLRGGRPSPLAAAQVPTGLLIAARLLWGAGLLDAKFGPAAPALALSVAAWELRVLVLLGLPRFAEFVLALRISRCLVLLRGRPTMRALSGRSRGCLTPGSSEGDADLAAD